MGSFPVNVSCSLPDCACILAINLAPLNGIESLKLSKMRITKEPLGKQAERLGFPFKMKNNHLLE
jgi:hypothetical protein